MYLRSSSILIAALTLLLCLGSRAQCGTIYVSPNGNDRSDGSSWTSAKKTMADGLNVAANGDEVWVAAGVYTECLKVRNDVSLYGGFSGSESDRDSRDWKTNPTVVDGERRRVVIAIPEGVTARIDGFTIRNGYGGVDCGRSSVVTIANNTINGNSGSQYGGGIACRESHCDILNNTISGNSSGAGGGVFCRAGEVTISGNVIENNQTRSVSGKGGGIAVFGGAPVISDNVVMGNSGIHGGGILCQDGASPTIRNNRIRSNTVSDFGDGAGIRLTGGAGVIADNLIAGNGAGHCGSGGGLYSSGSGARISGNTFSENTAPSGGAIGCLSSSLVIESNTIADNHAIGDGSFGGEGGGICCDERSVVTISDNTIVRNDADRGGGIKSSGSSPTVVNNIIASNSASTMGGGVYYSGCSSVTTGNTMVGNDSPDGGGLYISGGAREVYNNIVAFNTSGIRLTNSASSGLVVKNNNVYANTGYNYIGIQDLTGTNGNISVDPLFVDPANDDYRLRPTSPCVNRGGNAAAGLVEKDVAGRRRQFGASVDIGAAEFWPASVKAGALPRIAPDYASSRKSGATPAAGSGLPRYWTERAQGLANVVTTRK